MIVAIAIDAWKLTIFERRLTAAGFAYTTAPCLAGTILLRVEVPDASVLQGTVELANREAQEARGMN
jgi:hypothetical protein